MMFKYIYRVYYTDRNSGLEVTVGTSESREVARRLCNKFNEHDGGFLYKVGDMRHYEDV